MSYTISVDSKKKLKGTIQLPSSKSISNRVLVLNALCNHKGTIKNLSTANDTVLLKKLLKSNDAGMLNAEDGGTTLRFLLTYLCSKKGEWKVTGTERLFNRPQKPLLDALSGLGAKINWNKRKRIITIGGGTIQGGKVKVAGNVSSQFISSLLLCGAVMPEGLHLTISKEIVSAPYIDMTLQLLSRAGISYANQGSTITVERQKPYPFEITVENDWSSAAFIYQLAAMREGTTIKMPGLEKDSLQGDALVAELMNSLGVKTSFNKTGVFIESVKTKGGKKLKFHCADFPDMVPALVVTCAIKGIEAEFHDIAHLRDKESDRVLSLRRNLEPYGIKFKENKNKFSVSGKLRDADYEFDSFDDHRIAMCLAPLALTGNKVTIHHPEVVKKSFPKYWKEMKKIGFKID